MWWGTQAGKEGRKGEVRGRWVAGGGEGPGDAAKRGGVAAPGPGSKSGQQPGLTQPRQWFHHLFPKHLVTGDRKSPLESRDPPLPSLEGSGGSDPSCWRPSPTPAGALGRLLPWEPGEMEAQVGGGTAGDLGAG